MLVDFINDLDFLQNEELLQKVASTRKAYRKAQVALPESWDSDHLHERQSWEMAVAISGVLMQCLRHNPGREMAKELIPQPENYIVLKPKHSPSW